MPIFDLHTVHEAAQEELHKDAFKQAVEEKKKQLRERRLHIFPKRIRLQWPIRFEHWYNPDRK